MMMMTMMMWKRTRRRISDIITAPVSGIDPLLTLTADEDDDDDDEDDDDDDDYRHLHGPSVGPLLLLPDSDYSG